MLIYVSCDLIPFWGLSLVRTKVACFLEIIIQICIAKRNANNKFALPPIVILSGRLQHFYETKEKWAAIRVEMQQWNNMIKNSVVLCYRWSHIFAFIFIQQIHKQYLNCWKFNCNSSPNILIIFVPPQNLFHSFARLVRLLLSFFLRQSVDICLSIFRCVLEL